MSGHSKWATTKHKKAAIDAKRGKLFAKLIKNIEIAARMGGGDPDGNPSLYDAIYKAKKASMPADNIKRAVKRGSGEEAGGANYEDIVYEGYAPAGVGLIIECLTDNRNRCISPTERYSLFLLSVVVVKKSPLCSSLMTTAAVSVVFCPVSTHTFVIIPEDGAVISPFCCFRVFSFSNCFWNCSKEMALISCV